MAFKVSFNTDFAPENYESVEHVETDLYHFRSSNGNVLKVRKLSDESLAFQRITPELEIQGVLKLNQMTRIVAKVPEFDARIEYDAFMTRLLFNFPNEISFKYQLVEKGQVGEPFEVIITEVI